MVVFTGFDEVDLRTQPLLVNAGSEAESLSHSEELHAKTAGPKGVVGKLSPFFKRHILEKAG